MSAGDRFYYECSNGHLITSPRAITKCPIYRKGTPCTGTLTTKGKNGR